MALSAGRLSARFIFGASLALAISLSTSARAEDTSVTARRAKAARQRGMPYTVVEIATGIIALPAAEVCPGSATECTTGEVSLGLGLRNLYEFGPFGVGAGIVWGTTLRNDDARGEADLAREHARRYFLVETMFRYAFLQSDTYEAFIGTGLGLVSVRDSWTVDADRNPPTKVKFVGPDALVVGTEGLTLHVAGGGSYIFADNFSVGGVFRYGNWIMPFEPATSSLGDVASLSGRVDVFDLSATLAYRLAL